MLEIYKGEWKLFLKKWLTIFLLASIGAAVAGFVLVALVLHFDAESTYIYAGTFIMLYVAVLFSLFFLGNLTNARFNLLVSVGKKRSAIVKYTLFTSLGYAVFVWLVAVAINLIEIKLYPMVFANSTIDSDFVNFSFLYKYGLVLIVFLICGAWFVCALMRRFGAAIIAWVYLIVCAGVLVYTKLDLGSSPAGKSIAATLAGFFAGFTPVAWIGLGVILSAILLVSGYNILRRFDVRF